MMDITLLSKLDLSGVVIIAKSGPDGALQPVEGFDRMLAAARTQVFPRIHTAVVAKGESLSSGEFVQDSHNQNIWKTKDSKKNREEDFHLLCADTLAEAVALLTLDGQTRWREIIDCSHELRENRDFVGRRWLKERLSAFLQEGQTRYFLITGEPGAGKSAFMAESIRAEEFPIYHFIRKGMGNRDSPDAFFQSLDAQLRRKYLLPRSEPNQRKTPAEIFYADLERVSEILAEKAKRQGGIRRERIWLDGLDEAFGPTSQYRGVALPDLFREPPEGIQFILTSRFGEHLSWLADERFCRTVRLEEEGDLNQADVKDYFDTRNRDENLGLTTEFIDVAIQRGKNNFLFAVLLIKDMRKLSPGERTIDRIPYGLQGWMKKQLVYVVEQWMAQADQWPGPPVSFA